MGMETPSIINRWPGCGDLALKVPTRVGYRAGCKGFTWGFECPEPENYARGMDVVDCFKLYLDPHFLDAPKDRNDAIFWTGEDVQMWFFDFLTALHRHIVEYVSTSLGEHGFGNWASHTVEYIFSCPSTWINTHIVEVFQDIVAKAGFGNGKNCSVMIQLTEAEALVSYAIDLKHQYLALDESASIEYSVKVPPVQEGDNLLICEAREYTTVGLFREISGQGWPTDTTTLQDVCVMKVASVRPFEKDEGQMEDILELEQLDFIDGSFPHFIFHNCLVISQALSIYRSSNRFYSDR